jgi:hypothetical protein
MTWADYMRLGISGLMRCNAIATLDGWWTSKGANIEQTLAANLGYASVSLTGRVIRDTGERSDMMPGELIG